VLNGFGGGLRGFVVAVLVPTASTASASGSASKERTIDGPVEKKAYDWVMLIRTVLA
jgi:hypothetical protein